jgi:hypothetical protein
MHAAGKAISGSPFMCHVSAGDQAVQLGRESQLFCELADAFGNKVESAAANGADLRVRRSLLLLWHGKTACYSLIMSLACTFTLASAATNDWSSDVVLLKAKDWPCVPEGAGQGSSSDHCDAGRNPGGAAHLHLLRPLHR